MDAERLNRLDTMIDEGRIIRGAWTEGRERACLLAALSPEAGAEQAARACPAEVMPAWLAYLTPWLDDAPSEEAWPALVRRYAALARRWHALNTAAWERARIGALIFVVTEARQHVLPHEAQALAAIDGVIAWLRRGAPEAERVSAMWAAEAASLAAAAADAASAAAADAASAAAARAAAATAAAAVVAAPSAAQWAARLAARSAAADHIAIGVLDAIEREIVAAEGER